jgi:hypothetical protein
VIAVSPRDEAIAVYEARRLALLAEARSDERTRRPMAARFKREIARLLLVAAVAEEIDSKPALWAEGER